MPSDAAPSIRATLVARVYSRAGQDEPVEEHIDPGSGERVSLRSSEWLLLEHDRRAEKAAAEPRPEHGSSDSGPRPAAASGAVPGVTEHPAVAVTVRRRRRPIIVALAFGVVGGMVAMLGILGILGILATVDTGADAASAPTMVHTLVPRKDSDYYPPSTVFPPTPGAFAVFRAPGLDTGTFPDQLRTRLSLTAVAAIYLPPAGDRGVQVYAATAGSSVACLILLVPSGGMTSRCDSADRVIAGGLSVSAAVPPDPPAGAAGDARATGTRATDAVRTFSARWLPDGSFRMTERPDREGRVG